MPVHVENTEKPFFHMPPNGLKVPMTLHVQNRQRLLSKLRDAIANHATYKNLPLNQFVVILQAGTDISLGGSDSCVDFRQDSYFHWAFGTPEPDWIGSINLETGHTTLFVPEHPESFLVVMGEIDSNEAIQQKYMVNDVRYLHSISTALNGAGAKPILLLLKGLNTDSDQLTKPAHFEGIDKFNLDHDLLHPAISECRVIKTPLEIEVIRYSNKASSAAHRAVMRALADPKEPFYQYQAEAIFRYHCYHDWGMRHVSYTCIGASGCDCAVLHYGHAGKPNDQPIKKGDMCLFDMGGEYHCYTSDITCSFPCGGKFSPEQKIIYEAVLKANRAVFQAVKPGVSWTDMHKLAEKTVLSCLVAAGILKGNLDEMMQLRIGAVFQPHGLGHLLGCDTHDVGGYNEHCPPRSDQPGLRSLRMARVLEAGMVLTIEPGCYFIDRLLKKALDDPKTSGYFVKDALEHFKQVGGVRIEDDVVVTETGCELLTDVPRTVEEIEQWMAGGPYNEYK